jgi:hypothetical protein
MLLGLLGHKHIKVIKVVRVVHHRSGEFTSGLDIDEVSLLCFIWRRMSLCFALSALFLVLFRGK